MYPQNPQQPPQQPQQPQYQQQYPPQPQPYPQAYEQSAPFADVQAAQPNRLKLVLLIVGGLVALLVVAGAAYALAANQASRQSSALSAKVATLEADIKKLNEANAKATAQMPAGTASSLTVSEMSLRLSHDDKLRGLSYYYAPQILDPATATKPAVAVDAVQFTTQALISALAYVPDGAGQKWQPGNLLTAYFVDERADGPTDYEKAHLIKDFGDRRLIELIPGAGPFADKGFENFNKTYGEQRTLLIEVLKKAELIKKQ